MKSVMSHARRMLRQAVRTVTPASAMAADSKARICDNLLLMLDAAQGKSPIAVVVQLMQPRDISDVQAEIGPFTVKYEYYSFPAFAADLSKDQVTELATRSWVKSIEHDAPVSAFLDTSTKWFGVQKARADFGVSGDHDKNDGGYSNTDIVIAVVDTGMFV